MARNSATRWLGSPNVSSPMGDRELRDEVEALFSELKLERQKADAPLAAELATARTALLTEIAALTSRAQSLRELIDHLGVHQQNLARETAEAKDSLAVSRAQISRLQPLGDPLEESRSNWETKEPGCAVGVWLVLCVALSAAGWWIQ